MDKSFVSKVYWGGVLALALSACGGGTAVDTDSPIPTAELAATAQLPLVDESLSLAEPDDHAHPVNAPEHIHLDDGSVVTTTDLPIENELLVQLISGEPIAVGAANASAQTMALTIPTMF